MPYNSSIYCKILEQIQDTFLNIKFENTVYIYDVQYLVGHIHFLFYFSMNANVPGKMPFYLPCYVITCTILLLVCNDVIKSFN